MEYHLLGGYTIARTGGCSAWCGALSAADTRVSATSCAASAVTLEYARAMRAKTAPRYLGHNPLGGWMIVALLATLRNPDITGLFANDDIMADGPLRHLVSEQAVKFYRTPRRRFWPADGAGGGACRLSRGVTDGFQGRKSGATDADRLQTCGRQDAENNRASFCDALFPHRMLAQLALQGAPVHLERTRSG